MSDLKEAFREILKNIPIYIYLFKVNNRNEKKKM